MREVHPEAAEHFKDDYFVEFLDLPEGRTEAEFHRGLLRNLGRFITELGRDFCCVGSEYPVQVGGQDFAIDLLFFHRTLLCFMAIELKVRKFRPEDLGKLSFYLEALSPALVAKYQTVLPPKALLQAKLHEFCGQLAPTSDPSPESPLAPKKPAEKAKPRKAGRK